MTRTSPLTITYSSLLALAKEVERVVTGTTNTTKLFNMIPVEDRTLIPFGKYKGTAMANVPAEYLIYVYENFNLHDNMKAYIKKNMDVLKAAVVRQKKFNSR